MKGASARYNAKIKLNDSLGGYKPDPNLAKHLNPKECGRGAQRIINNTGLKAPVPPVDGRDLWGKDKQGI